MRWAMVVLSNKHIYYLRQCAMFTEESYTSRASSLERDPLPSYHPKRMEKPRFSGKREKRGIYRALDGRRLHADINGSYNVLRKAVPKSFGQGIVAPAVVPVRLPVLMAQSWALTEAGIARTRS
jgi:hypothetical protein